jgi:hypothetical protein
VYVFMINRIRQPCSSLFVCFGPPLRSSAPSPKVLVWGKKGGVAGGDRGVKHNVPVMCDPRRCAATPYFAGGDFWGMGCCLACWMAQKTASGVAGEFNSRLESVPNAAAACRNASRTLMASITGGSPTALLP